MAKLTVKDIVATKSVRKITMLTSYDFLSARLFDMAEIDILLVGDSMGMVVYGEQSTLPVTLEQTIAHTKAVAKGAINHSLVVGDMPFLSFGISIPNTAENAGRIIKQGLAEAVKLEGGSARTGEIKALLELGIPVMGHLGLTPQSIHQLGGYKVQGKTAVLADHLINEAKVLERAGVFSIVLEAVPWQLAKEITSQIHIPTIGIGAGLFCDGQVLVGPDMLGLTPAPHPKFVKKYASLDSIITTAAKNFSDEVKNGNYPDLDHSYSMSDQEYDTWKNRK